MLRSKTSFGFAHPCAHDASPLKCSLGRRPSFTRTLWRAAMPAVIFASTVGGAAAIAGTPPGIVQDVTVAATDKPAGLMRSGAALSVPPGRVPPASTEIKVAAHDDDDIDAVVGAALLGAILSIDNEPEEPDEVEEIYIEEIPDNDVVIIDEAPDNTEIYIEEFPEDSEVLVEPLGGEPIYVSQPAHADPAHLRRMRRCAHRYRSFDWPTGTFVTYGGVRKLCPYLR